MENVARRFLKEEGEDIEDYNGWCLELVDDVLHFLDPEQAEKAEIMYMDVPKFGYLHPSVNYTPSACPGWKNHAVIFLGGLVHDALLEEALPVAEYLRKMFPNNDVIEVTYNSGMDNERVERWIREEALRDDPDLSWKAWQ